jgi:hypothetical protein
MRIDNPETQNRVKQYFRVKARQLAAMAELPVCEHPGLIGSHREELQRIYLREVLPRRFEVGRGMVYGPSHRSKEADIVIWDSQNYPNLPMLDHSFFFAESVRVVLESKSAWREEEFQDVLEKSCTIRDIVTIPGLSLTDEMILLRQEVAATQMRQVHVGTLIAPHHIGTAAIFLTGGHSLNPAFLTSDLIRQTDDSWPDILLLLESGRVVIKNYQPSESIPLGGEGWLEFYDLGEDALFAFTVGLLAFLEERSVQVERPLSLTQYVPDLISIEPTATIDLSLAKNCGKSKG